MHATGAGPETGFRANFDEHANTAGSNFGKGLYAPGPVQLKVTALCPTLFDVTEQDLAGSRSVA